MSKRVIVIGGGLAGLSATIKAAEAGYYVDLFSMVPVKRSHSVCAQGGINAAKNMKGEGDHPDIHVDDTLFGGEFLANQPLVEDMCHRAPEVIDLLDRMGVPFNRTAEGQLDFRRFGGTLHHRTAFSGATTGQQLIYALDEQVRRFEAQGMVEKYEYWEFLSLVLDDDRICRGVTAMNVWDRRVEVFRAGAVILATGGPGLIFGRSTNSVINTGAAASRAYQQGAWYGNGEFIQVHPTTIPGLDKLRLISESVRGEGGRVWVPKNKDEKRAPETIPDEDRDYFLERKYPKYGNLVPRDVATREIFRTCVAERRGIEGENKVYLDITPEKSGQAADVLERKLGGVFEIYRKFVGVDPLKKPMQIFPGMHYSMGGLWIGSWNKNGETPQMTNIPGCFAAGEVDYQYHGANRLGANSLLSCIYGGMISGEEAVKFSKEHSNGPPDSVYEREKRRQEDLNQKIASMTEGDENVFALHRELGNLMSEKCTVVRHNDDLKELMNKLHELEDRWERININDPNHNANQAFLMARAFRDMVRLAKAMAKGAIMRDECRGAHYKPEFENVSPEKSKLGNRWNHDGYRKLVQELKEKWDGSWDIPEKTGEELTPEYKEYLDKWVEQERKWNKTTIAEYKEDEREPEIHYEEVIMTFAPPRPRIYA